MLSGMQTCIYRMDMGTYRKVFIRAYLEPSQTSKMELFCENSKRVLILKYFFKNNSIKAFQHHPKYAYELFVSSLVQCIK